MRYPTIRTAPLLGLLLTLSLLLNPLAATASGDPVAGEVTSAVCAACHGTDGNSISADFPKIAGQIPGYVATQLAAYQSGARDNAVMKGLVLTLTEQDMQNLDAYYASKPTSAASISEQQVPSATRGQEIYRRGLSQFSVPACMACHGPAGQGIPARYPKVSGQFRQYLITTLLEFKSGQRVNEEMNTIAFRLTQQQIQDVSTYMQGLN